MRLLWGVSPVEGIVIGDQGNLGVGGRRLYRNQSLAKPAFTERSRKGDIVVDFLHVIAIV